MNKYMLLLLSIAFLSCKHDEKKSSTKVFSKEKINSVPPSQSAVDGTFGWIVGNWKRVNDIAGRQTYEHWKKIDDHTYSGHGYSIVQGDTVSHENIKLVNIDDRWDINVTGMGESKPTVFRGVRHNNIGFTCENNEIEFPNRINYWTNENRLNASISSPDTSISFIFVRLNK